MINIVLKNLGLSNYLKILINNSFSVNHFYVLRILLNSVQPFHYAREPRGELEIASQQDFNELAGYIGLLNAVDKRELLSRFVFYQKEFPHCYLFRINGKVAYLQWLVYPTENANLIKKYGSRFHPLSENGVMLENAFTFPQFRGRGLLPYVSGRLLNIANDKGFTNAITYVRKDRIVVLNEFLKMGFKITNLLPEYKLFGYTRRFW